MRRFAGTVALVLPLLAALACGGRVGVVGGGGGGDDGGGICPAPTAVTNGGACTAAGLTCATTGNSLCGSTDCTCTGDVWACSDIAEPCIEQCPTANDVQPGSPCNATTQGACDVPLTSIGCDGTQQVTGACGCQPDGQGSAAWLCSGAVPECPDAQSPPPPACPEPQAVEQGVSCFSPGAQCPGNPTYCDGAVFYDAFECDDGAWNDVAVTGCDGSGSSSGSGGGPVDAGSPEEGPPDAHGM